MRCPACKHAKTKIIRTKADSESESVARTRACENPACAAFIATHEAVTHIIRANANPQELRTLVGRIAELPTEQVAELKRLVAGL